MGDFKDRASIFISFRHLIIVIRAAPEERSTSESMKHLSHVTQSTPLWTERCVFNALFQSGQGVKLSPEHLPELWEHLDFLNNEDN